MATGFEKCAMRAALLAFTAAAAVMAGPAAASATAINEMAPANGASYATPDTNDGAARCEIWPMD